MNTDMRGFLTTIPKYPSHTHLLQNEENKNENIPFEEIFKDNIDKQVKVSQQFYLNFEIREKHMNTQNYEDNEESHAIQLRSHCPHYH